MANGYRIERAARPHVADIMADIRVLDHEEWIAAAMGRSTRKCLKEAIAQSNSTNWSIVGAEGKALAMFGANRCWSSLGGTGNAWMIATNEAQEKALRLQRLFRDGIGKLHEHYPKLRAWAYDKNTVHHFWMERVGFVRTHSEAFIGLGHRFLLFTREQ